jgi:hypothetical protein
VSDWYIQSQLHNTQIWHEYTNNKISSGQVNFCLLHSPNLRAKIFANNYCMGAEPPPSNISMPSDWFVQIMWQLSLLLGPTNTYATRISAAILVIQCQLILTQVAQNYVANKAKHNTNAVLSTCECCRTFQQIKVSSGVAALLILS